MRKVALRHPDFLGTSAGGLQKTQAFRGTTRTLALPDRCRPTISVGEIAERTQAYGLRRKFSVTVGILGAPVSSACNIAARETAIH